MACEHTNPSSMFFKRQIRVDEDISGLSRRLLEQPCPFCNILYAAWKSYGDVHQVHPKRGSTDESRSDDPTAGSSVYWAEADSEIPDYPIAMDFLGDKPDSQTIAVKLESGQFGEAYQILICGLILKHSRHRFYIEYGEQDLEEIKALFRWYRIRDRPKGEPHLSGSGGKDQATAVIHAAFLATQNPDRDRDGDIICCDQVGLFQYLRLLLDGWLKAGISGTKREDPDLAAAYFEPSYAGKYWLNRYFRLTNSLSTQVPRVSKSKARRAAEQHPNPANWTKLPKAEEISRLAVIHIRRTPKTEVGRIMDDENLKQVAQSIANANKAAKDAGEPQFSHVMLYGDFNYSTAHHLKSLVEKCTTEQATTFATGSVQVSFISRPWGNDPRDLECENDQVDELWRKFRNFDFDHLPLQVKTLAIWVALCKRYCPKMCVIGHRSGFIEAAGLVGIPVFYLNNERWKVAKGEGADFLAAGVLLYRPLTKPDYDRLRLLGDVMNTFIPVETLKEHPEAALEGDAVVKKNQKAHNTHEASEKSVQKDVQKIFRVHPDYKDELAAALFMYMCSETESLRSPAEKIPGWRFRVKMMHDSYQGGGFELEPGNSLARAASELKLGVVRGQRWLQQRYLFAIHSIRGGQEWPKPQLPVWMHSGSINKLRPEERAKEVAFFEKFNFSGELPDSPSRRNAVNIEDM